MPIFEFKCADCGKEFEELVIGSGSEAVCPDCGSKNTERLMSCCCHKTAGQGASLGQAMPASSGGGGCAGCSGGNCSSCH